MSKSKILVVDDDKNICELIRLYIEKEGFEISIANTGCEAIDEFTANPSDLVLLDIMLPDIDGLQVCREIRQISSVPIIMLTAKDDVFDKVLGLEMGADDYIIKPFDMKELLARIKAVLRRINKSLSFTDNKRESDSKNSVKYDNLYINIETYDLIINDKSISIPKKEMELIFLLATNPNRVFSREQILQEIWGYDYYGDTRTVDVHIKRLREKLSNVSTKWDLKTVWGVGYKFEVYRDR